MVNFGLNAAAILGLFLAVAGAGLFFLRSIRPELARDYDIFFAAVGLLCGIILLFNGWRLDPILQFGQFLLTGTAIFFAFESIRMRGVATEQARRNTPIVDRDRPVSRTRVYTEAEFDQIDPYDDVYEGAKPNYSSPRLRGYDDPQPRPSRRSDPRKRPSPGVDMRGDSRRPPSRNRAESSDYGDRPNRNRRPDDLASPRSPNRDNRDYRSTRRSNPASPGGYDSWNSQDEWTDRPSTSSRPRPRPQSRPNSDDSYYDTPSPPVTSRRRPNPADLGRSYDDEDSYDAINQANSYDDVGMGRSYEDDDSSIPGDYVVDYQPMNDSEADYSDDYDDSAREDYDYSDDSEDIASNGDYDDYDERSINRKPINFNDHS